MTTVKSVTHCPTVDFVLQPLLTLLVHCVKSGSRHLICSTFSVDVILSRLAQNQRSKSVTDNVTKIAKMTSSRL